MRATVSVVLAAVVTGMTSSASSDLAAVLERAAAYVADLEQKLPALVVEERYTQAAETSRNLGGSTLGVTGGAGVAMQEGDTVRTKRQSRADVLLVRRPQAPLTWSAARSVLEIDGAATGAEAGQLEKIAADPKALAAQWPRLAEAGRKVHVGPFERDVLAALAPLALLRADQRDRVTFKKEGEEKVRGVAAWKVGYVEHKGPTLFTSRGNVPQPARGTFWIDPGTGQVLRVRLESGDGRTAEQFRLDVEYAADPATGALLPSELREKYQNERGKLDGRATFSGYRVVGAR